MTYVLIAALLALTAMALRSSGLKAERVAADARAAQYSAELDAARRAVGKLEAQLREKDRSNIVLREENRGLYERLGKAGAPGARDEWDRGSLHPVEDAHGGAAGAGVSTAAAPGAAHPAIAGLPVAGS